MRDLLRWIRNALGTLAKELWPGRIPTLRPVPKAVLVVAAGLVLAFVLPADARPAALTEELARKRLARFLRRAPAPPPILPAGEVLAGRPLFRWPAVPGAAAFDFRLSWDGGEVRRSGLAEPRYLMRPPGRLAAGRAYRFEAQALGADGRPMGAPVAGAFTVAEAPPELRGLEAAARLELEPSEGAFVLAGWFAEFGSPSDVAAALAEAVRGGAGAPEALDVLAALGCR